MPLLPGCSRFQYASSTLASCALHGRCSSRAQASLQASASPSSSPRLRIHDTSKMSALLCRPSPSPRHLALPALLVLALRGNPFAQAPVPFGRSRAPGATHVHRPPRRPRLRVPSSVSLALRFGFLALPALRPHRASPCARLRPVSASSCASSSCASWPLRPSVPSCSDGRRFLVLFPVSP